MRLCGLGYIDPEVKMREREKGAQGGSISDYPKNDFTPRMRLTGTARWTHSKYHIIIFESLK